MKSLLRYILLGSAFTLPAFAILDLDVDGMSDVWETQHGYSTTGNANASQAPAADPDGDGASNLLESVAGTNPTSATPPLGLYRMVCTPNLLDSLAFDLQWPQFIGKEYQVQSSADLSTSSWSAVGASFIATAPPITFTTPARSPAEPHNFFRVQVADVDPDFDGLSSAEEQILGTNPDLADSDGDGTPDKIEIIQGSTPTDPGDNGQPPPLPPVPPLPLKVRIYTYASLAADYVNGGNNGLLTPYRIKIYEQNLGTGVETLVHTTPDYGGTMLSMTDTVQLPNLATDPTKRYNAQIDLPNIGTDAFSQPYRRWSFFLGITASAGSGPFVAVSGFDPVTQQFGIVGQILGTPKPFDPGYESYRAVIAPVEIVDTDKNLITELKVAKIPVGQFKTLDEFGQLYPGNDDDCFYIRVKDAATVGGISVKVSTTDNPDVLYNDDATQIDLSFDGTDWISESMIMVSDDVDDDQPVDGIADDVTNDRTHKIQLGGNFKIEAIRTGAGAWQVVNFKAPASVKKTVHVNVVILRDKPLAEGGVQIFNLTDAMAHWKIVSERYAQVGVKIVVDTYSYRDPPTGVDLADGLKIHERGSTVLSGEAKSVISNLGTIGTDDIHIFYVPRIDIGNVVDHGVAIADFGFDEIDDPYTYNAFVAKDVASPHYGLTAAHELGHLLTNDGHGETTTPFPYFRLMYGGGLSDNGIMGSKRLNGIEGNKIRSDPHAK